MKSEFYSSRDAAENKDSFFNVIRVTGRSRCPFMESLKSPIPFKGDPAEGHSWAFRTGATAGQVNAFSEGSKRATITKWPVTKLNNRLQILKKTSGMSKSQMAATTVDERTDKLEDQKLQNRKQMQLDMEYASLTDAAPTSTTDSDGARKDTMGGAKHFAGVVIDASADGGFDYDKHISEPLKYMWKNGIDEDKIVMTGADVKTAINNHLNAGKRHSSGEKGISQNVTHIEDSGWGTNIPITPNMNLADNELLIYAPDLINPVLLRAEKDNPCSDPQYDGIAEEDVIEQTIQVLDPNTIIWVKNIPNL